MGQKASRLAGGATSTARRYPTRVPQHHPPHPSAQTNAGSAATAQESSISEGPGPTVHPATQVSYEKDEAIRKDAADPDYASMLRTVGVVQVPDAARRVDLKGNANPQLRTLTQRQGIEAAQEKEQNEGANRTWVDIHTVRDILRHRDESGMTPGAIEKMLKLKSGVVDRLGLAVKNA